VYALCTEPPSSPARVIHTTDFTQLMRICVATSLTTRYWQQFTLVLISW